MLCVVRQWLVMVSLFFVCRGGAVLSYGGVLRAGPPSTLGSARWQRRCGGEVLRTWRDGAVTRRGIVFFFCLGLVLVGLGGFLYADTPALAPRFWLSGGNVRGGGCCAPGLLLRVSHFCRFVVVGGGVGLVGVGCAPTLPPHPVAVALHPQ